MSGGASFLDAITPTGVEVEVEQASDLAAEELAAARAEADRIRAAARAEGYADGLAGAHDELRPLLGRLAGTIGEANRLLEEREDLVARTAIELAMQTAGLAVNRHLELSGDAVVDAARASLARVREAGNLRLHVHPSAVALITAASPELAEIAGSFAIVEDITVEAGGAKLVCNDGEYDAQPSEQLARLEEAMVRALAEDVYEQQS